MINNVTIVARSEDYNNNTVVHRVLFSDNIMVSRVSWIAEGLLNVSCFIFDATGNQVASASDCEPWYYGANREVNVELSGRFGAYNAYFVAAFM